MTVPPLLAVRHLLDVPEGGGRQACAAGGARKGAGGLRVPGPWQRDGAARARGAPGRGTPGRTRAGLLSGAAGAGPPRPVPGLAAKITTLSVPGWSVPARGQQPIAEGTRWWRLTVSPGRPPRASRGARVVGGGGPVAGGLGLLSGETTGETLLVDVVAALRRAGLALPGRGRPPPGRRRRITHPCSGSRRRSGPGPAGGLVLDDLHLLTRPELLAGLDYVLRHAQPRPPPGRCPIRGWTRCCRCIATGWPGS